MKRRASGGGRAKRKRTDNGGAGAGKGSGGSRAARMMGQDVDWRAVNEDDSGDGGMYDPYTDDSGEESGDDGEYGEGDQVEPEETAEERKIRLAKQYLKKLATEAEGQVGGGGGADIDDEEDEEHSSDDELYGGKAPPSSSGSAPAGRLDRVRELVGAKLRDEALASKGALLRRCAAKLRGWECDSVQSMRGHQLSVTSLVLSEDGSTAFTGSKDCSVVRWDLETGKRVSLGGQRRTKAERKELLRSGGAIVHAGKMAGAEGAGKATKEERSAIKHHTQSVLCAALSTDGKFLATGGADRAICIWDTRSNTVVDAFTGHRDIVSALSFRKGTHTLYSGSHDRAVKVWNLDEMAYVETLFGHQAEVNSIDCMYKERAVTCASDRSARLWKIVEESQLVFRGNTTSMDCCKLLNEQVFVTGAQDGELNLWHVSRKKPIMTVPAAHTDESHWICSVATLPNSDLVASGSNDGYIRFWRAEASKEDRVLEPVAEVKVDGFVNAMAFDRRGRFLVAGIGNEHRMGRWWRLKRVRPGLRVIRLPELGIDT